MLKHNKLPIAILLSSSQVKTLLSLHWHPIDLRSASKNITINTPLEMERNSEMSVSDEVIDDLKRMRRIISSHIPSFTRVSIEIPEVI